MKPGDSRSRPWEPWLRAPPSEFGLDVTVAIAAITEPDEVIVCVTDRMISFHDQTAASDDVADKAFQIHKRNWLVGFAAQDVSVVWPIIKAIRPQLADKGDWNLPEVKDIVSAAYIKQFHKEFLTKHLVRLGFESVQEFKDFGLQKLGREIFGPIAHELNMFHLGAEFLVYGFDSYRRAHIFDVRNPGHVTDHSVLKYAAVGSGYDMAVASLRRKRLDRRLAPTIYRLLEAKFSSETASGVGKTTGLLLLHKRRDITFVEPADIAKIRKVWETEVAAPDPKEATEFIANLDGVRNASKG